MAQIALTFDLCVWDIKSLTLSGDMREELKRYFAEWWPLVAHSTGVSGSARPPSGHNGRHVRLHQLEFKLSAVGGCRRDKNSLLCKELSF